MTACERIAQDIAEHDSAIDVYRSIIHGLTDSPIKNATQARMLVRSIHKYTGRILCRLAQQREAKRILEILEHEAEQLRGRNDK